VFDLLNSANHAEYHAVASSSDDYGTPASDYARRQAQLGLRYEF
jgi:hypothetical protein